MAAGPFAALGEASYGHFSPFYTVKRRKNGPPPGHLLDSKNHGPFFLHFTV